MYVAKYSWRVEHVNVRRHDMVGGGKERCGRLVSFCLYVYWNYIQLC